MSSVTLASVLEPHMYGRQQPRQVASSKVRTRYRQMCGPELKPK